MIMLKIFMQKYSVWRMNHLNQTVPLDIIKDLPGQTIFHCLDSLNDVIPSFVPHDNPFLFIGTNKKYIRHVINFEKRETDILELPDKGIYMPIVPWQKEIAAFTKTTNKVLRYVAPTMKDPILNNSSMMFISYNFLFRTIVRGQLSIFRKFNYIFSGLLNNVISMPDKTHFINIPLPKDISLLFKRPDFDRTFLKIDKTTLKYPDFPHYLFFVYLLNFVHNKSELGPINAIPHSMWPKINFIINNDKEMVVYNLGALKDLNTGSNISKETEESYEEDKDTLGSNRIIYRMLDQINNLCTIEPPEDFISPVSEEVVEVENKPEVINAPTIKKPISSKVTTEAKKEHKKLTEEIEEVVTKSAEECIINNELLTERQKSKALENSKAYKKIVIDNKSADEILHSEDHDIDELHITALEDSVEDKSMLKSTVINFDSSYMNKTFKQDLLGVLQSFNKLGMFLTELKEEDLSDELSQMVRYTIKFTDSTGAAHPPIKFILPKVDPDGRCYLNGVYRMMKKQRVNLPICKVSATRVSLTSSYNKSLVERVTSRGKQFYQIFTELLLPGNPDVTFGRVETQSLRLPYDYTEIANKMIRIKLQRSIFIFDYPNRFKDIKDIDIYKNYEKRFGIYCGYEENTDIIYFMNHKGAFIEIDSKEKKVIHTTTISNKIARMTGTKGKLNEYVHLKLLSKNIPLAFVLCYKYGLSHMLKYLNVNYTRYDKRVKFKSKIDDVVLSFKDCSLVIHRVPLINSLIFGGLAYYKTDKYTFEQMDDPDVYYDIFAEKGMTNYLKGIDSFFDLFIGYVEYKLLKQMGEPTNMKDLLIRATTMLTTSDHKEASSSSNFRIRSYEKFVHIIYNELARSFSTWKHKSLGHSNKFTVNPFVIQQRINADGLFDKLDVINPIHQIKAKTAYSHLGEGGRTASTFMLSDRKFTKDSVGILSEATVDNSSVAINGGLSMNPSLLNTNGLTLSKAVEDITPSELLSITSLLFPCITQDDGKRNNFVSIQSSQFVPLKETVPLRVRTGYEKVVPHLSGKPFATIAKENGKVIDINDELKIIKIQYASGKEECISFDKEFSNNSGNGMYIPQNLELNNYKVGDKVTKGDVVVFNKDFFINNDDNKQVDMSLGIPAMVAFIEKDGNLDDASIISEKLSKRLEMDVAQVVTLTISPKTNIYDCVKVGDNVQSTDTLMTFDENPLSDEESDKYVDDSFLDLLNTVNRVKPKAKYTGIISDIHAYYKCDFKDMSKSVSTHIKEWIKQKNKKARYANDPLYFPESKPLTGDKVGSTLLTEETIIIKFTIQQSFKAGDGDKIFVASANKSIISDVATEPMVTEDGIEIDLLHSTEGVEARIVNSPYLVGLASRVMGKLQEDILAIYDE